MLRPGGRLLLSVPFGKAESFGWFRQFDSESLAELVGEQGHHHKVFRYVNTGWRRSTLGEVAGAHYRDAGRKPYPADGAIAARAVTCVRFDC